MVKGGADDEAEVVLAEVDEAGAADCLLERLFDLLGALDGGA